MRIAAIYWPTSSVGGINTELRNFRAEADRRGDTFHVLRSGLHKTINPCVFKERKTIRGGDTFITIDGEAPHHPTKVEATLEFLHANYDRVYYAFLCPHPTKDYGDAPHFIPMYSDCLLPITSRVTDGYWESYAEWGTEALKYCDAVTVSQPAFASFFEHPNVTPSWFPFDMKDQPKIKRAPEPLTVWTSQWKAIKGIHKLLPHLDRVDHDMEMYSNGILYYQLRSKDDWKRVMGDDWFAPEFSGNGKIPFFGCVPWDEIPAILARSWFMIDLMGAGKPKNAVYTQGSFNNTTVEALWYGSCPVLHSQAKAIPGLEELCLFVEEHSEVPELINKASSKKFSRSKERIDKARKWVKKNFDASKVYNIAVLGEQ